MLKPAHARALRALQRTFRPNLKICDGQKDTHSNYYCVYVAQGKELFRNMIPKERECTKAQKLCFQKIKLKRIKKNLIDYKFNIDYFGECPIVFSIIFLPQIYKI